MRSKAKTRENFLKQKFEEFVGWGFFEETLFEWHSYDNATKQVFIYIEGEWTPGIREEIENHLKGFNKRITMSRIIKGPPEINEETF